MTRDDQPVAVVVARERYRGQRERIARIEAAYWTAWVGDQFDPARFVEFAGDQITPPGELSTKPPSGS